MISLGRKLGGNCVLVHIFTCLWTRVSCSRLFSRKQIFCFWAALPSVSSESICAFCSSTTRSFICTLISIHVLPLHSFSNLPVYNWSVAFSSYNLVSVIKTPESKAPPLWLNERTSSRFWMGNNTMSYPASSRKACFAFVYLIKPQAQGWRWTPSWGPGSLIYSCYLLTNQMAYLLQTLSVVFPGFIKISSWCKLNGVQPVHEWNMDLFVTLQVNAVVGTPRAFLL